MTREEAKKEFTEILSSLYDGATEEHYGLIDNIYDSFESKTCENCKHFKIMDDPIYDGYCTGPKIMPFCCFKDFGCNQFENK